MVVNMIPASNEVGIFLSSLVQFSNTYLAYHYV